MVLKYTPGPWLYNEGKNIGYWPYVQRGKDGGNTIQSSHSQERANADAQLIAAAPDLLEALKNVQALIAKASINGFTVEEEVMDVFTSNAMTSRAIAKAEGKNQ